MGQHQDLVRFLQRYGRPGLPHSVAGSKPVYLESMTGGRSKCCIWTRTGRDNAPCPAYRRLPVAGRYKYYLPYKNSK